MPDAPIKDNISSAAVQNSISTAAVPYHTHNGLDSPILGVTGASFAATLTNKRITSRVGTITTAASYVINTDSYDCFSITALAGTINTIDASGSPTNFQPLTIRIKDNGSPQTVDWSTNFASYGSTLLATTTANKIWTGHFRYDSVAKLWGCVGAQQQP